MLRRKVLQGLLLAAPAVSGQDAPRKVSGRVISAATGEPLRRARVELRPIHFSEQSRMFLTTTDGDGRFVLHDVDAGGYRLTASRTGYLPGGYGKSRSSPLGHLLDTGSGQGLEGLEVRLEPSGMIAGRVLDEEGEPIPGVAVSVMTYGYIKSRRQLNQQFRAYTDDLGEYRASPLASGKYLVMASAQTDNQPSKIVDQSPGASADVDLVYAETYYPNAPAPNAATSLAVRQGARLTGIDIRLAREQSFRVGGRVKGMGRAGGGSATEGLPVSVTVMLLRQGEFSYETPRHITSSHPDGSFMLRGVAPGSYTLVAQQDWGDRERQKLARIPLSVTSSHIDRLKLHLAEGQTVQGSIESAQGVTGLHVALEQIQPTPYPATAHSKVNAEGTFLLKNVPPDTYRIRISASDAQWYVKSALSNGQEWTNRELRITAETAPTLRIIVRRAAAEISGTVSGMSDKEAESLVVLIPGDATRRQHEDLYRVGIVQPGAVYGLTGIEPGEYGLIAWQGVDWGAWMDPDFLRPFESRMRKVVVGESGRTTVDLEIVSAVAGAE